VTFIQPGSPVKRVLWEAVPDKYAGPKVFAERAEAEAYADETYGRVHLLATFPEGEVRLSPEEIAVGDSVLRVEYHLHLWADMPVPVAYDELTAAVAAVPAGRTTGVFQMLWIGRPGTSGVRVFGDTLQVTGGEVVE